MREKIGDFQICSFDALTTHELYEMMRARADVFVGEEKILYPDADGVDYDSIHVFRTDSDGRVIAYLRMFRKADEPGTIQRPGNMGRGWDISCWKRRCRALHSLWGRARCIWNRRSMRKIST